jgi:hypothetical protein
MLPYFSGTVVPQTHAGTQQNQWDETQYKAAGASQALLAS